LITPQTPTNVRATWATLALKTEAFDDWAIKGLSLGISISNIRGLRLSAIQRAESTTPDPTPTPSSNASENSDLIHFPTPLHYFCTFIRLFIVLFFSNIPNTTL
jgi:hypothetical protein